MDELVVQTNDLTKRYGNGDSARLAVDRVSMTVRRGEVYGFLGPNGAGKTTTLRMVLGLIRPTAGSATVLGDPAGEPADDGADRCADRGPRLLPLPRPGATTCGRWRATAASPTRFVDAALERVDLADRGRDRFKSYSLGMKQRLGVAAALMGDPELIVLDEPTNGLDPAGMADMRALIVDLARGGQTVLLSSHLLAEVEEICDRVGVIARGRLLVESTVSALRGGRRLRGRGDTRGSRPGDRHAARRRGCGAPGRRRGPGRRAAGADAGARARPGHRGPRRARGDASPSAPSKRCSSR